MQIAEGWTVDIQPKAYEIINNRTDKTWPTTWFAPVCATSCNSRMFTVS